MPRLSVTLALVACATATLFLHTQALELSSTVHSAATASSSFLQATEDVSRSLAFPITLNSECMMKCTSQTALCSEECMSQSSCSSFPSVETQRACQLECSATCMSAQTMCLENCGAAMAEQLEEQKKHPELSSAKPQQPQPRPSSENVGLGPETVKNWAGYISVNGTKGVSRHLWYWFFESRNSPSTDPLMLWMTGGPGCSSLVALFYENGPYIIGSDLSLKLNPNSWNRNASIIWIDQPVNTGYSYADAGDLGVMSEVEMADNMHQFLESFLVQYPQYAKLPFVIAGESYAGHYVPALASRILQGNEGGETKINLESIAIGNGLVDPAIQYTQYAPFAAATGALNAMDIFFMNAGIGACELAISGCNGNSTLNSTACLLAVETCNLSQLMPYQLSGKNVYDYTIACEVPPLCYDFSLVDKYLAQPDVQAALGVTGRTWQSCNQAVNMELVLAGDWMRNLAANVPAILASGVRVVVYSGEHDFICNWYGGQAWSDALVWPGKDAFNSAANTTWTVDGKEAGSSRTAQGFTFVRVKDAGHMVPMNQPVAAYDLISRVISGAPFDSTTPSHMPVKATATASEASTLIAKPAVADEQFVALA